MNTNEDLTSVIGKIINSPEFAGMVRDIRGDSAGPDDVSGEMMKKLPNVMKTVSSMFGSDGKTADALAESSTTSASTAVERSGPAKYDKVRAEKLLHALKPYLNSGRGEVIDRCLSVLQVSDLARALGGLEGIADIIKKGGE